MISTKFCRKKVQFLSLLVAVPCLALAQTQTPRVEAHAPRVEADAGVAAMLGFAQRESLRARPGASPIEVLANSTAKALARLCTGEVALAGAARQIAKTERESCARKNVAFVEIAVAADALFVVVNPANTWAKQINLAELKRAWLDVPGKATSWRQMNAAWPQTPLKLYGPGPNLGLSVFARDALTAGGPKPAPEMRRDITATEILTVAVEGVARDRAALGLVDRATYEANRKRVRLVPVAEDQALAFPVYVYASAAALKDAGIRALLDHLLANGPRLAAQAGLGALTPAAYLEARQRIAAGSSL